MKKNLLKILIIISIFLPFFASAALNLENAYPTVPGTQISLRGDSTLGETIKYFSSWAIFIGAIVAFIALIYAGLLYLSSIGRPAVMNEAQNRIYKSFLGLAILLGSYIILIVINPQLIVMRADKTPIISGVILLDTIGTDAVQNPTEGRTVLQQIEKSISDGNAYPLTSDIKDAEEKFGKLIKISDNEVNFENFKVVSLAFTQKGGKNVKVIAYHKKNFSKETGNAFEYIYQRRIDEFGEPFPNEAPEGITWLEKDNLQIMHLFNNSTSPQKTFPFHEDEVKYFIPNPSPPPEGTYQTGNIIHPPLSFEVENIWPGIYLYGDNIGEEVYIGSDEKNLSVIDFNNKTKKISVVNQQEDEKDVEHDFLSILYEDKNFYDNFRLFFLKKERKMPGTEDNGDTWKYYDDIVNPWYKEPGNLRDTNIPPVFVNSRREEIKKTITPPVSDQYTDQYGKVEKPSSVQVFNLDGDNPNTCQEVRVCTKPDFLGSCIVYTPLEDGKIRTVNREEGVFLATSSVHTNHTALPIYTPKNIGGDDETMHAEKIDNKGVIVRKEEMFKDNINSIKITGNCLVALFQNAIENKEATDETFWDERTPGNHSQIFTESQNDLSHTEICRCGVFSGFGNFGYGNPCASAIAIYPIK